MISKTKKTVVLKLYSMQTITCFFLFDVNHLAKQDLWESFNKTNLFFGNHNLNSNVQKSDYIEFRPNWRFETKGLETIIVEDKTYWKGKFKCKYFGLIIDNSIKNDLSIQQIIDILSIF